MRFHKRPVRMLSMLVVVAVTSAYAFATGTTSAPASNEAGSSKLLIGKLVTNSNRPITVNGGQAITGTTILSGAKLETPAVGGAIVELSQLGLVSIAPNSSVTLFFDPKTVTVNVNTGYASLSTAEGVKGTVTGLPTNAGNTAPVPATADSAEKWGIAGVAVGSAAFIWAIIAWNRANNARDDAAAANAAAASLAAQLAALRTCLAGQTTSPLKLCTSF